MLPGIFGGDLKAFLDAGGSVSDMPGMMRAMLGPAAGMMSGGAQGGDTAGFTSGYREPAMSMTPPPPNFWKGGQFYMGGGGAPLMTSDVLQRFPGLASIAGGGGPGPMPPAVTAPTPAPASGLLQQDEPAGHGKRKKNALDKLLSGGLLGLAPALGGKGGGIAGVAGLIPGLLFD